MNAYTTNLLSASGFVLPTTWSSAFVDANALSPDIALSSEGGFLSSAEEYASIPDMSAHPFFFSAREGWQVCPFVLQVPPIRVETFSAPATEAIAAIRRSDTAQSEIQIEKSAQNGDDRCLRCAPAVRGKRASRRIKSRTIIVEMFTMEKASSPDVLYSGGLWPCVAIGIYDPRTKSGYMIHYVPHAAGLEKDLERVRQDFRESAPLRIYVHGNSQTSEVEDQEEKEFAIKVLRPHVLTALKQCFPDARITVRWLKDDYTGELYLNTANGKFSHDDISLTV
ncbi:MAG: hypothetical protein WC956_03800 [bacterium]